MARTIPAYTDFDYRVATNPDGSPYKGHYTDGRPYYNVLAVRLDGKVTNAHRVVARTDTLENARALVEALVRYTTRGSPP